MKKPEPRSIPAGQSARITVAPQPGWITASVHGDTCTPSANGDGTWTAANITDNCAVQATFIQNSTATITLTSSANPSIFGTWVTFTAKVASASSNPTPTGKVDFVDGGVALTGCKGVSLNSGVATCAAFSLSVGSHNLQANFNADDNTTASSNTLVQIVNAATTSMTFNVSPNPARVGQVVTLIAMVDANVASAGTDTRSAATSPGAFASPGSTVPNNSNYALNAPCFETMATCAPAGTVTFFDGKTQIGSGTVDQYGMVTLNLSSLSAGTHALSAIYSGSGYTQSTAQVTLFVNSVASSTPVAAPTLSWWMLVLFGTGLAYVGAMRTRL